MTSKGESQGGTAPTPADHWSLMSLLCGILRLPDETLAMAYIYVNSFSKYARSAKPTEPIPPLDSHTIALAALSLACKSTEAPRRLREFLLPSWRILHPHKSAKPLKIPSALYDTLRSTLVQAELILLRVLKFELKKELPFKFLPRYLDRALGEVNGGEGDGWMDTHDYDGFNSKQKAEYRVISLMDTSTGKTCKLKALEACRNYYLANHFPSRVTATVSVYLGLQDRGLRIVDVTQWLKNITSGKVDLEDFQEALEILGSDKPAL